ATSVDAEHAFSRGRLTVSRLRRSLADESVRANTVLGSWARIDDLIPEKELIDFLTDKKGFRAREAMAAAAAAAEAEETGVGEPVSSAVEDFPNDDDDDLYA
ncbi:hypothetical protein C8T65DRAFT_574275, partial [Cerioporus squamosus]